MSSVSKELMPKRLLDFGTLAIGASGEIVLADRVVLDDWRSQTLQVRVHSHTFSGGSGRVAIVIYFQSWTDEDPAVTFLSKSPWGALLINSGTGSPDLLTFPVSDLVGVAGWRVSAIGTREGAGVVSTELSVSVTLQD